MINELDSVVQTTLTQNRAKSRASASKGILANFTEGYFVLVALSDFNAGEKLCLRLCGPRRIVRPILDHLYQVEDFRNGSF